MCVRVLWPRRTLGWVVRAVVEEGSLGECPMTQEQTPGSQDQGPRGGMRITRKLVGGLGPGMENFFSLSLHAQASQTGILSHMQPQIISLK